MNSSPLFMPLGFPLGPSLLHFLLSSTKQTKSSKLSSGVPSSGKPLRRLLPVLLAWVYLCRSLLHRLTTNNIPPGPTPLSPEHRESPGGKARVWIHLCPPPRPAPQPSTFGCVWAGGICWFYVQKLHLIIVEEEIQITEVL